MGQDLKDYYARLASNIDLKKELVLFQQDLQQKQEWAECFFKLERKPMNRSAGSG
jgi:hypothetical protein